MNVITGKTLGFFTVLLLLTLNGSTGKDLLDVTVSYVDAKTSLMLEDLKDNRVNR